MKSHGDCDEEDGSELGHEQIPRFCPSDERSLWIRETGVLPEEAAARQAHSADDEDGGLTAAGRVFQMGEQTGRERGGLSA